MELGKQRLTRRRILQEGLWGLVFGFIGAVIAVFIAWLALIVFILVVIAYYYLKKQGTHKAFFGAVANTAKAQALTRSGLTVLVTVFMSLVLGPAAGIISGALFYVTASAYAEVSLKGGVYG